MTYLGDPDGDPVIISRHGRSVELTGRFKEAIFKRGVKKYLPGKNFIEGLDPINEYKFNNYGYRGPDFVKGVELVTAGCSQTYGVGVPEQGTWSALLAKQLGMSYVNLSAPGVSIEWIVHSLFSYFNEFGNPKVLAVLFPDFLRMEVVINSSINQSREVSKLDLATQGIDDEFTLGVVTCRSMELDDLEWRAKINKRPFFIEDTIPPEEAIFRSMKHIMMLESYCEAAGIELIWSGWSDDVAFLLEKYGAKNISKHAIKCDGLEFWKAHWMEIPVTDEDPEGIHDIKMKHGISPDCPTDGVNSQCVCFIDCHSDLKEKFEDSFYLATDRHEKGKDNCHMGVHRHAHIADDFAEELLDRGVVSGVHSKTVS